MTDDRQEEMTKKKKKKKKPASNVKRSFSPAPGYLSADWPPSLCTFVKESYGHCETEYDKVVTDVFLRRRIQSANLDGSLMSNDWSQEPFFPLPGWSHPYYSNGERCKDESNKWVKDEQVQGAEQQGQQVMQKPELGTDKQVRGAVQQGQVKRGGAAHTEEPNIHSPEFSSRVAEPTSTSPSFQPHSPPISCVVSATTGPVTFWRPWEVEDKASSPSPNHLMTPQGRVFRRARKRRSAGDLNRRRQRQTTFQANPTTPSSTHYPEPEQRLESGISGEGLSGQVRLNWSNISDVDSGFGSSSLGEASWSSPPGQRRNVELNSTTMNTNVLFPPPSQTWWASPGWDPACCPSTPQTWMQTSNLAPPSPVYCDGCHSWGNLLSVTVSQTRGL